MELSELKALINYWNNKEDDAVRSGLYYRSQGDTKTAEEYKRKAQVARDKAAYWKEQKQQQYGE